MPRRQRDCRIAAGGTRAAFSPPLQAWPHNGPLASTGTIRRLAKLGNQLGAGVEQASGEGLAQTAVAFPLCLAEDLVAGRLLREVRVRPRVCLDLRIAVPRGQVDEAL